jgi:hypothetical protein
MDDVLAACVTERLRQPDTLSAPWLRLRELLAKPVGTVELSQADRDTDEAWRPADDLLAQRKEILNYGGTPPYEAKKTMELLGVSTRQALGERRRKGQLLGLPVGERRILYPRWQFDANGKLLSGLDEVLASAPRDDPWGVADILTSPQGVFDGRSPIQVLEGGEEPDAVRKTIRIVRRAYD